MAKPSPPPAPDYQAAAQSQGQANVHAAQQQGIINNPNVISPYGTQTVSWQKAPRGSGLNQMPVPTLTQTLNPAQQAILEQTERTQGLLGGLGQQGAESLQGVVGKPVDFSGSPAAPVPGQVNQKIVDAMMQRPTADYARAVDQSHSDLAAAGIPVGSKAYNTQQDLLGRQLTDAQTQAELAGVNAGNTAFNQGQAARQSANTENLTARQTPINEITALMSGSQVSNPFSVPSYAQNAQVAPAPVFGATQAQSGYGTDIYNANAAQQGNLVNGLFGLAGSGMMGYGLAKSDRRLKSNIVRLGTHPLGIGWYAYDLDGQRQQGVMAQEVLTVKPEAVQTHSDGYLLVDYGRL